MKAIAILRWTLVLAFFVLPAGVLRMLPLDDGPRAIVGWSILIASAVAAFARASDRADVDDAPRTRAAITFWTVGLLLLSVLPLGLQAGGFGLGLAQVVAFAILGARSKRGRGSTPWLAIAVAVVVGAWMALAAPETRLDGDGPAHLGGVHDALDADRWRPRDPALDADASPDPRFGALHGLYAAVSAWTGAAPVDVFTSATMLLVPLALLGQAAWMRAMGTPRVVALILALIFAVGGAGGRGFGLWRGAFPGDANVGLVAFALAGILRWIRDPRERAWPWVSVLLLGSSTALHPFAWWIATMVMGLGVVVAAIAPGQRERALPLGGVTLASTLLGALLLAPRMFGRGEVAPGLHDVPTDVILLGNGSWFVVDPLSLVHWGGTTALLVGPLLLLAGRRWWRRGWAAPAAGAALLGWVVALNPLAAAPAWSAVSYLLLRTTRLVVTPWWWWDLGRRGVEDLRRGIVLRPVVLLLAILACAVIDLAGMGRVLSTGPPREDPVVRARLDAMAEALRTEGVRTAVADPRTSYGLRARLGGAWPLVPAAHSNPDDVELARRLSAFRRLHAAVLDSATWNASMLELGRAWLIVQEDPRRLAPFDEFGWIPRASAARRLRARVEAIGAEKRAQGDRWSLWKVEPSSWGAAADTLQAPALRPDDGAVALATGSRFEVVQARVDTARAAPGGAVGIEVVLRAKKGPARTVHPEWEKVYVRWSAPSTPVPPGFARVDKLYRKAIVERSMRSRGRFGRGHVPFDGTWPPEAWPEGRLVVDRFEAPIPIDARGGPYALEISIQEAPWRPRRDLRDLLRDEDRFRGPVFGRIDVIRSASN